MDRREALRLLATGAALQLAPGQLFAALREARTLLASDAPAGTLTPHQKATVTAMAELIFPRTDTPGATDVGVPDFVDLMLTEWYDEPERTRFLNGLSDVDERTNARFGKSFVESSPEQQANILTALGEKMMPDMMTGRQSRRRGSTQRTSGNFYLMLRHLTLTGYYTSEAGATEALHFQIIPDSHEACAEIPSAKGDAQNQ
jgi:hypothetical protein